MRSLLSIDPGKTHCGMAVFTDGLLFRALLVKTENISFVIGNQIFDVVVVEKPQVYKSLEVDSRDLVDLAIVAGEIGGVCRRLGAEVVYHLPSTWKKGVPKEIHGPRIRRALEERGEWDRVEVPRAKSLLHNVIDAAGLGLFEIGRRGGR